MYGTWIRSTIPDLTSTGVGCLMTGGWIVDAGGVTADVDFRLDCIDGTCTNTREVVPTTHAHIHVVTVCETCTRSRYYNISVPMLYLYPWGACETRTAAGHELHFWVQILITTGVSNWKLPFEKSIPCDVYENVRETHHPALEILYQV